MFPQTSQSVVAVVCHSLPAVLRSSWLRCPNPQTGRQVCWSASCYSSLFSLLIPPYLDAEFLLPDYLTCLQCKSYIMTLQRPSVRSVVSLPPHRPHDCCINHLPGALLPSGCLYHLSRPKQEATERYVTDSLAAGLIRSFSSPLWCRIFLRPEGWFLVVMH